MRETWVGIIVAASGVLAVLLALAFAWSQNPGAAGQRVGAAAVELSALALTGREIYQAKGCPLCHAIAGAGNPRYPLDGVGDRLDAPALRDWILATGTAAPLLPRRAAIAKEGYRDLGADEIDALVAYLSNLRASAAAADSRYRALVACSMARRKALAARNCASISATPSRPCTPSSSNSALSR